MDGVSNKGGSFFRHHKRNTSRKNSSAVFENYVAQLRLSLVRQLKKPFVESVFYAMTAYCIAKN